MKMDSLTEDLLANILAKLPLKIVTTSKLVCKQWKSIVESKFFCQLFQSHHQNSHSLWSLMCSVSQKEVMAHYGCNTWGLTQSLGSYISSFTNDLFKTRRWSWHGKVEVRVVACTDVGLILITLNVSYFVANPISREYVEIPPLPCLSRTNFRPAGLVTQVENDVVLSYKVVLIDSSHIQTCNYDVINLLIYSSETGLWSYKTIRSPLSFRRGQPISLNGHLYWIGINYTFNRYELVYHNFYTTDTESDQCRVIPFPGADKKDNFRRVCTTSQGYLMYMKIVPEDKDDDSFEHKLSVWKLKSGEWQLVSEISPDFMYPGFDHIQLTINPFDAKTVYFWSRMQNRLASINLDKCKIELQNKFECSSNGCNQRISEGWYFWEGAFDSHLYMFVLPRWLYRIPF